MSKKNILENDGERMIPGFHKGTVMYAEHMTRYIAAQDLSKDKVVLDIASGSGYGTQILSKSAKKVYGVDVDKDSIKYAKENFLAKNIEYLVGDGEKIPLENNSVDLVITFETIEHVKNYRQFIKEIKRVLKDDGLAIVSTPNALEFTEGNHFHLHEFEYEELSALLRQDFLYINPYFQATWVNVAIAPEEIIQKEGAHKITTYNYMPLQREKYLYFYLLCSNRPIKEKIEPINALGGHYSARELTDIQNLNNKNIRDYKTVLQNIEKDKTQLTVSNKILSDRITLLESEISNIVTSKRYRLATKLASTKAGITGYAKKSD